MAKKITDLERQYKKELTRIKRYVKSKSKDGFITELYSIPSTPSVITEADVQRLKNIRAKDIRESIGFVDVKTGELITGYKGVRFQKTYQGQTSSIVIDRVLTTLENYSPQIYWSDSFKEMKDNYVKLMTKIFKEELNKIGAEAMEARLQANAFDISTAMEVVMYDSEYYDTIFNYNVFLEAILGEKITMEETLEYSDYYGEYMETHQEIK